MGESSGAAAIDAGRKRVFLAEMLSDLHRRLAVASKKHDDRVDALLSDLDRCVMFILQLLAAARVRSV
jgi:hypothetical protein